LVFGSRRAWIHEEEDLSQVVMMILEDDRYSQVGQLHAVEIGDVAIYRRNGEITHAGIVYRVTHGIQPEVWVLSQWGADGEFSHMASDVPVFYGDVEFWTDRK
jgi:hypothetical protein